MQGDDVSKICVDFLIIWCKPFCDVNVSIFTPSKLILPLIHQLHDFTLKSPTTTTKNGLKVVALSKFLYLMKVRLVEGKLCRITA